MTSPIRLSTLALALAGALLESGAWAQEEFTGSRSLGMAGAHRAIVTGNDAVYLNPAGMPLTRKYALEGGYLFDPGTDTHIANVSVVDSVTSRLAAGVSYSYVNGRRAIASPDGGLVKVDRTGHLAHLALAAPLGREVTFGLGAKYLDVSYQGRAAANAVTVDAGIHYRFSQMFSAALVGYGLTNSGSAEAPLAMAVGLAFGPSAKLSFALDWVIDFTTRKYLEEIPQASRQRSVAHEVHLGLEWMPAPYLALRAGYFHDRVTRLDPDNAFTFGIGFFSPKSRFGFNAAYAQRFRNTDERQVIAALQLFL
jgi:hypothetical protein